MTRDEAAKAISDAGNPARAAALWDLCMHAGDCKAVNRKCDCANWHQHWGPQYVNSKGHTVQDLLPGSRGA